VKPPVDAPTSAQVRPRTSRASASSAASSFSPPRETKRGPASNRQRGIGIYRGGRLERGLTFTRTCPAMMRACALARRFGQSAFGQ